MARDTRQDLRWQLAPTVRIKPSQDGKFVLENPRVRSVILEIDRPVKNLLTRFRRPCTFVDGVVRTAVAEKLDPYESLRQLEPLVARFVRQGVLVRASPGRNNATPGFLPGFHPGGRFKEYRIVKNIRTLVDSEVYLLERDGDRGAYVLKIMPPRLGTLNASTRLRAAWAEEFRTLARLRGTAAVELVETGCWRRRVYGILRYAEGGSVQREAVRLRAMSTSWRAKQRRILRLFCRCLRALESIHARGYLHGDIHPGNFFLEAGGDIRIVDFGCAQRIGADNQGERGYVGGVVNYLPPEVAGRLVANESRAGWTVQAEIYATAAMAYQLLLGQHHLPARAFRADALAQIVTAPSRTFEEIGAPSWPEVERILRRALAKTPAHRFASLRGFRVGLERALKKPTGAAISRGDPVARDLSILGKFSEMFVRDLKALPAERMGQPVSLAYGSAGVAFVLWRAAIQRDDPELLAEADRWAGHAVARARAPKAFRIVDESGHAVDGRRSSLFFGEPGVHFVATLVANALGATAARTTALNEFLKCAGAGDAPMEMLQGVAGHLIAASVLFAETRLPEARDLGQRCAKILLENACGEADGGPWPEVKYNGLAHGLGGIFYALLQWAMVSNKPLPRWFLPALSGFARSGVALGDGLNWPVLRQGNAAKTMTAWCHGAPGLILLWTKAHEYFARDLFLVTAQAAARHVLRDKNELSTVCCGLGGKAYALRALSMIDPTSPWRDRAIDHARRALIRRHETIWPLSFLKGGTGLCALSLDLLSNERSGFPMLEA